MPTAAKAYVGVQGVFVQMRSLSCQQPVPAVQSAATSAAVHPPAPAAAPKWTVGEVNKMTVPKLKAALTELGLATDGLKKVLKERLLAAL